MDIETNEVERERAEARKKKRQKERMQAMLILAGAVGVIALVLIIVISVAVHIFTGKKADEELAQVEQEDTLDVDNYVPDMQEAEIEEEEESLEAEDVIEEEPEPEVEEEVTEEVEVEEEIEEEVEEEPSEDEIDAMVAQRVSDKISSMTIEEKVAQLFFVTPGQLMGKESTVDGAGSQFNEKLNQYNVGGILFEDGNMRDADTLQSMLSNIQLMVDYPMFLGIEDEGGENSPLVKGKVSENVISSQKEIGASLGDAGAYSAGISVAGELKMFGFNVDFAPYADVSRQKGSVAEQRGFGVDMEATASLTKNYVKGLEDQGMKTAAKYFPSYGDATQDGKNGQVTSQRTKADLEAEYLPYQEAIDSGADFVMISHVGLPKIRGDRRPASLSKEVITDIVRDEWGYEGIVITDYMNKSCIYNSYTYAEAAVGAIEAGADMILSVKNFEKSYNGLLDAVKKGQITEERLDESLQRIFRVKYAAN